MLGQKKLSFQVWVFLFFVLVFLGVACSSNSPAIPEAEVGGGRETAVPTTPTPSHTPSPSKMPTLTRTAVSTQTAVPSQTPFPYPISSINPFPTVTPNYFVYETKPIFITFHGCCGDGGSETDDVMGRDVPSLIIYGDGQMIITEGTLGDMTYFEAYLSPTEMCQLRQEIADTGFLDPHEQFFTERDESMGGGHFSIQVENIYYEFYSGDVRFLVEDLAAGYQLIRNFRPENDLVTYIPQYLVLWIEEIQPVASEVAVSWPGDLPSIDELWSDRETTTLFVEDDLVRQIYELFDYTNKEMLFQENGKFYSIIARPILPNETPYRYPVFSILPRDYVPVLNCEGETALISPAISTVTPTLTSSANQLTGQGRIVFTAGTYWDYDMFVMDANGSNRLRLTNDQYLNSEPAWSPDGQQIAFSSKREDNVDIYVINADGTNLRQLTDHPYDDYSPSWSPDGSKIVFVSDRDGSWQTSEIYMMNADGSDQVRLTYNESRDLTPVWSPDGQKIAFVQEIEWGISSQLIILDVSTNTSESIFIDEPEPNEQRYGYSGFRISRPAWSPDGTQIAITILPNASGIHILDLYGSEIETFVVDQFDSFDWSANGRFLVFSARKPNEGENAVHYSEDQSYWGNWDIYALELATGEVIQITFSEQDEMSPAIWP
ncbi:MAG: PD40 domain-containing protein [Ardenticatenaceae bacterium]|nr:PD40 domain-containing protein [Ardenticatenaceae bacterium]